MKNVKGLEWAAEYMQALPSGSDSSSADGKQVEIKLENRLWPQILEKKDTLTCSP